MEDQSSKCRIKYNNNISSPCPKTKDLLYKISQWPYTMKMKKTPRQASPRGAVNERTSASKVA